MSHGLRGNGFIETFVVEARKYQQSELLKIPEVDAEEYDPERGLDNLTKQTMCYQLKRVDNKEEVRSRQEIIKERRHIQNMRPTLRYDLSSTGRESAMKGTSHLLFKRTRSTNMRHSLS